MKLEIEYKDGKGKESKITRYISKLALIKHMAIAGQGYTPSISTFKKGFGIMLAYSSYFPTNTNNYFNNPPAYEYDPTEKSHFSNLAGKAIADYLAKSISGAKITYNYEAAMRIKKHYIKGGRPDLLCDTGTEMFAIEAKGYSKATVSENEMKKHKKQSGKGSISVKFSVASVSYNMYSDIKVKYHDPINKNYQYDYELSKNLIKEYYSGILQYINSKIFSKEDITIGSENYYKIRVWDVEGNNNLNMCTICGNISILLNKRIQKAMEKDGDWQSLFNMKNYNEENIYIDTDGIGIIIE